MQVKILGKVWRLKFLPITSVRGDCDPPNKRGKLIRISTSLVGEERLEVLVHEMLHAAGWHIDEEFVRRFSEDVARELWKLGYRMGGVD